MATSTRLVTPDQFRAEYGSEGGWEYWFGEAVRKGTSTTLHGIMQFILMLLFDSAGYHVGSEVDLRIDPDWEPRPDVLVSSDLIEQPYPTRPAQLTVIEILSPDDAMQRVIKKRRHYTRVGIETVFIVDPEMRDIWRWSATADAIERAENITLPDGFSLTGNVIWQELEKKTKPRR